MSLLLSAHLWNPPSVLWRSSLNSLRVNLRRKLDFPAPASPARTRRYIGAGSEPSTMLSSKGCRNITKRDSLKQKVSLKHKITYFWVVFFKIKLKLCVITSEEKAGSGLRTEEANELALLGATDTAASDFTSDNCNRAEKQHRVPKGGVVLYIALSHYHVLLSLSDLHLRVAGMHSFHRASAVVTVIVAAQALRYVHLHWDPTVQVPFSPVGHVGVLLGAALKHHKSRWNELAEINLLRAFRQEEDAGCTFCRWWACSVAEASFFGQACRFQETAVEGQHSLRKCVSSNKTTTTTTKNLPSS